MSFGLVWDIEAAKAYDELKIKANKSFENRKKFNKTKASKEEGLFKQVKKSLQFLKNNPRHPSLATHEYSVLVNPYNPRQKVFEAYVQQNTPAAYRIFWCYGPKKDQITVVAITAHP
jgi:hypothetical protein